MNAPPSLASPPLLRRVRVDTAPVRVTVDGVPVELFQGDSVATAVLMAGHSVYRRTILGDAPRAPFCMMGVCFECLVEIDGIANRQGCLVPVREGMRILRQIGLNGGLDSHEGFAG